MRLLLLAAGFLVMVLGLASCGGDDAAPAAGEASSAGGPLAQSPFLGGSAAPVVPRGEAGKLTVVTVGKFTGQRTGTTIPVIIRNNTTAAVSKVEVTPTAKDAAGKTIATGSNYAGFHPATIQPGEVALGYIYFDPLIPQDAKFDFSFTSTRPSTRRLTPADLNVEAKLVAGKISGTAKNATSKPVEGPFTVDAFCFDSAGTLTGVQSTFADNSNDLAAGASVGFEFTQPGPDCPQFLAAVFGFY